LGEVFVTLHGEPYLLWPAVDQHGAELDILLLKLRDKAAAKRCLKRVLAACPEAQRRIATSLSLVMSGGATALPTRDARCAMRDAACMRVRTISPIACSTSRSA
jgi:transposase-like protein